MRLTRSLAGRIVVSIVFGASLAACFSTTSGTYAIRSAQAAPQACMDALMSGSLERHPVTGLGIASSDVDIAAVEWPFGYRARIGTAGIELLDETGKVVAREHDRVNVGGGMGAGGLWFACAPVTVESQLGG